MAVAAASLMPIADFLAWETQQDGRHEYYRGEVFAMVGARRVHGIVSLNLGSALRAALRGTPCRAFVESMKLRVADHAVFYPDVFVTCDARDLRTEMVFEHPTVVIEVLSDSTEGFDRGRKFASYRQIASLREYVLVDPVTRSVEVFRRNDRDQFVLHEQTRQAALELDSLALAIPMAEVFDGVEPEPVASNASTA